MTKIKPYSKMIIKPGDLIELIRSLYNSPFLKGDVLLCLETIEYNINSGSRVTVLYKNMKQNMWLYHNEFVILVPEE
jgi:hypothetical protein